MATTVGEVVAGVNSGVFGAVVSAVLEAVGIGVFELVGGRALGGAAEGGSGGRGQRLSW
ncbi:hypothetical protein SBD_5602 [Streptomyces bottropensis ATCC 25435]|uniref:Uncharacterized protein n=1 Tax=Streptomyces bottropensis ATCC 25435 TaxID=1054862 RepID=M3E8Q6_9ACTN|nr:hypothetical protein SBD_5602 [Streptomyces bottropensis ATCC 25435]